MASLSTEKSGCRRIQFTNGARQRKIVRLGKMPMKAAQSVLARVEKLNALAISKTSWGPELARWVGDLDPLMYDKMAAVGLVPKRATPEKSVLQAFLDAYVASRTDVTAGTALVHGHVRRNLLDYFPADKPLQEINQADAEDWRRWLATAGKNADGTERKALGANTIRKRCSIAKQFFQAAVRRRLIAENPFAEMKDCGFKATRERDHFVSRAVADKVLAACPDAEWKLIFALSRYGGLRCPSETLSLRWGDINWETSTMLVRSPKTEHHGSGHSSRVVPIFPELRPYLETAWDNAAAGTQFVVASHRGPNANLRTQLERIIINAGVAPWPKLFQNLRATRATELAGEFAAHVAADWLGHSTMIAQKHYWRTTDADIQKAISGPTGVAANPPQVSGRNAS